MWVALLLALTLFALPISAGKKGDVINSGHNLSASGTGPVKSSQTQVCIFCHTPHSAQVDVKPLWNHAMPTATYNAYTSSTMSATGAAPSVISKQCLSCHDGTIAIGQTIANGLIATTGAMTAADNLGADLRNDHPISFNLVNDGQLSTSLFLATPTTADPAVKLRNNKVECVTCHDPHTPNTDPVAQNFLVRSNSGGALCLACHDVARPQPNVLNGWATGAHRNSANTVSGSGALFGEYGNVAANACVNCHMPHSAPANANARMLRGSEEASCSQCHSGANLSPSLLNIMAEFTKTYTHPTTTVTGLHDAAENTFPLSANRHAECADCHNSHAASSTGGSTVPPASQSSLLGVSGVDNATGATALRPAANEFQICYKCHANSTNKPQSTAGYATYGRTPVRQTFASVADPHNVRLDFNTSLSRHPVSQPRYLAATAVPSLRPAIINLDGSTGRSLGVGTYIYCTDCHTNNQARNSKGTGPNGPHGSTYPHLLERRYEVETAGGGGVSYVSGVNGTYALCDKCHDIANSIMQNRSFREHSKHISGERASCSTCHSAHGIQGGNATNNKSLMNFDTAIVTPYSSTQAMFQSRGTFTGACYIRCHGDTHSPETY
jgi:predicted CXXCH cytochrome family protein